MLKIRFYFLNKGRIIMYCITQIFVIIIQDSSRSKIIRPRGTNAFMAPDTKAKLPAITPKPFVFRGGLRASSHSHTAIHMAHCCFTADASLVQEKTDITI